MTPNPILIATDAVIEKDENGNIQKRHLVADTVEEALSETVREEKAKEEQDPRQRIVVFNLFLFAFLHLSGLWGIWLIWTAAKWQTNVIAITFGLMNGFGITAGAHRLWAHKSYKAKWPLRLILMIFQTSAHQNAIYEWVRDHRVHHKFTDTDADPHNAKRGFFFSHIGWLMMKKHREVLTKGRQIDMSDLEADPIVMFQKKYFYVLMPIFCFFLPPFIPWYFSGEKFWTAWHVTVMARYCISLNATWLVNSAAHIWGMKPYDKNIGPVENRLVAALAFGEGWHNYHHVFPWDYKTAELGKYGLNYTTAFIDFFAKIGWAYDLKTVTEDMIRKRTLRTGDGSHPISAEKVLERFSQIDHESETKHVWGWDDKDISEEEKKDALIISRA